MNGRILLAASLCLFGVPACQHVDKRPGASKGAISIFEAVPGDVFEIRYASSGCFHHVLQEIRITRTLQWRVEVVDCSDHFDSKTKKMVIHSRRKLGTTELGDKDAMRLDRLLETYRLPLSGGCTTVDHIDIIQKRGTKILARESFVDASCAIRHREDLMTLWQLVQQAEKSGL